MNVATAPTDQIEQIPLYPRLSDTEIETENLWLLKVKNKHNNILYNYHNQFIHVVISGNIYIFDEYSAKIYK